MVIQIDQQNSSITPAIVLQSNNNNIHCSNTNNNSNNNNPNNSSFNTTISMNSSSSSLEEDPIEEFETDNECNMDDSMPKSSSFSVADTESDIESDADTEITGIDESEDCPLSPAPSRANTNGVTINSSIFQSVISQLKENEKYSKLPTLPEELKYTIVLDIDETLLHSFFPEKVTPAQYQYVRRLAQAEAQKQSNSEITFEEREFHEVDVGDGTIVVAHLRPHMWDFLRSLFRSFNVAVWSAGGRLYVDNMCKLLFPSGTPQPIFSFCWEDCHLEQTPQTAHFVYTKPMHCLTSRFPSLALSHLILIDNRKENGFHYPHQIVHCPDFFELPWLNALKSKNELIQDQFLKEECMKQIHNVIENMKYLYNNEEESKENEYMEDESNWEAFSPNPNNVHNNNNSQSQHLSTDYDLLALMKELQNEQVQARSISRSFSNSSSSAFFSPA